MKGALGWALLGAVLLVAAPAGAARQSLDAQLDYQVEGAASGTLTAHDGAAFVLAAGKGSALPAFDLRGTTLAAMIIRSYSSSEQAVDTVLPLLDLRASPESPREDDIAGNTVQIEERVFEQSQLRLLESTALWHVAVFDHPDLAGATSIGLPSGDYGLANAPTWARLTRGDQPQPQQLRTITDPVQSRLSDLLEVRADGLAPQARGEFYALLYGGTFEVATPDALEKIVTGRYEESYTDDQGLPARRSVNATMLLHVTDGVLAARNPGPGVVYAPQFHLLGRLALTSANGILDQGDGPLAVGHADRTFDGDLRLASNGARYTNDDGHARGRLAIAGWTHAPATASLTPWLVAAAALGAAGLAVRTVPGVGRLFFAALGLFSMAGRHDVLAHQTRAQILDLVRERPGASLSSIQRGLGLGWGTMSYHVALLERTGLVITKRAGGKRLLFAQGDSRLMEPAAWGLLQNPSVRALAETLLASPQGITQSDLSRRLDCSTQYVGRLLRKLEQQGLVAADPLNGRLHAYRAGPRLLELAPRIQAQQAAPAQAAFGVAPMPLAQ